MTRVLDAALSVPWAIHAPALTSILDIIARHEVDPAALAAWKQHMIPPDSPESLATRRADRMVGSHAVMLRDGVAVVPVIGPIVRYAGMFTDISGGTALARLATDFQAALDNPEVKSILLEIDSPGGEANGIAEFAAQVRAAAARKPVTAYVGGMGASAAYWIAASAGEIVVSSTAMLGSIGTVAAMTDTRERDAKAGVRQYEFVSSQSPLKRPDPATDAGRAAMQSLVDRLSAEFVTAVAAYRGVSAEAVLADFGQGGLLVGADAVAAGMADRLGSLESTLASLAGKPVAGSSGKGALRRPVTAHQQGAIMSDTSTSEARQDSPAPIVTASTLSQTHPAVFAEIKAAGAAAERSRILAIQAQALPGHDSLVARCIEDGTEPGAAAQMILAAEKAKGPRQLAALAAEAQAQPKLEVAVAEDPKPVADAPAVDPAAPLEDRAKAVWAKDSALRAEFSGDFNRFLALAKAEGLDRVVAR
ncbi:hypothetical protein H261_03263 [Paramagnetospirillum caucaseum]|uniref:Peptidase S49 domain-containing protein n=1 Tax=Paramagnetospirillum caucaseum TaxID=1244869 RepID=M2ZAG3_9PROT|nr:S49 family peptidase [Paramagnetospirillum caucaseum]EME71395.1 hypothetical protein H261_03263 [Paramagnetospirillum caucaseum]